MVYMDGGNQYPTFGKRPLYNGSSCEGCHARADACENGLVSGVDGIGLRQCMMHLTRICAIVLFFCTMYFVVARQEGFIMRSSNFDSACHLT